MESIIKFIEIPYQGQTLRGMHHLPQIPARESPTVILFHGFTANRIEGHRLFYQISLALQRVGIASIRCDFLGSGESDGDYADMTLSSLVAQAHHIVSWCQNAHGSGTVYLLGFSMGGLVASLVAEHSPFVPKVALISPGRPRRILERDAELYADETKDVIDIMGNRVGRAYYTGLSEYLNRPLQFHSTQNILIIHGTKDLATPIAYSQEYLDVPGGQKRLVEVPGADHGYSSLQWQATLLNEVVRFFDDKR